MNVNELLKAMEAAVERMETVSQSMLIERRSKGVSPVTHVHHAAAHLEQHAKKARAALNSFKCFGYVSLMEHNNA